MPDAPEVISRLTPKAARLKGQLTKRQLMQEEPMR
jgi:hypothetical protein